LQRLCDGYRVVPHGVSLSVGAAAPLDRAYLGRLKALVARVRPPWWSDHLCWGQSSRAVLHDLLPLPHTPAVIAHVVERVRAVQDFLEVPFALENVSSYLAFAGSSMP